MKFKTEKHRTTGKILTFAMLLCMTGFTSFAEAAYSLPASRSVKWEGNVGVVNDIPTRSTVYTTLSPSGGNDTTAIQTAITNCPSGQVVKLNAGTFNISSPITVKSNVTLRGAGMGKTIIKGMSGMSGMYVVGIRGNYSKGTSYSISAGLAKGSTTITTTSAHGWSAGDIILIDQLNAPSGDPVVTNVGYDGTCSWCGAASGTRSLGQMVKVASVPSSNTATLEIPLYWNYNSALAPKATEYSGFTVNAGMEDFTIDNSLSGSANQSNDGGTVMLRGATNSWLLRVEGIGAYKAMVKVHDAYRNTIRGGKYHEGSPALPINGAQYGWGRAYGFFLNPAASANLIENNEVYHLVNGFLLAGAVSGNVFGYNYITQLYSSNTNWQMVTFGFHGGHPVMNLFEGNYSDSRLVVADNVWGSSSHNTFFRNRHSLTPNKTGAPWNLSLDKNATYFNVVGNVLGTLGVENIYELQNVTLTGLKSIYRFGYTSDGDGNTTGNDPRVFATALRHGNWDSYHNSTLWNGSDDRVLPASMYLGGKPAWWGNTAWPAVGPDLSPMYPAAPGAGKGTPWGSSSKPGLSAPTSLRVQ